MRARCVRGSLLVATPVIGDENFDRTVVLMLEHTDEGALGLVLNRPTEVGLLDPLPEWEALAADPAVVFVGGPVEQGAAIALARARPGQAGDDEVFSEVLGPIGTVDLSADPARVGSIVEQIRVFAGYAGWGPGQLEGELAVDAWFVVTAEPADVLSGHPDDLWGQVLQRQGGDLALLAAYPPDPSCN